MTRPYSCGALPMEECSGSSTARDGASIGGPGVPQAAQVSRNTEALARARRASAAISRGGIHGGETPPVGSMDIHSAAHTAIRMKRQIRRLDRVPPRKYPPQTASGAGACSSATVQFNAARRLRRTTTARQCFKDDSARRFSRADAQAADLDGTEQAMTSMAPRARPRDSRVSAFVAASQCVAVTDAKESEGSDASVLMRGASHRAPIMAPLAHLDVATVVEPTSSDGGGRAAMRAGRIRRCISRHVSQTAPMVSPAAESSAVAAQRMASEQRTIMMPAHSCSSRVQTPTGQGTNGRNFGESRGDRGGEVFPVGVAASNAHEVVTTQEKEGGQAGESRRPIRRQESVKPPAVSAMRV